MKSEIQNPKPKILIAGAGPAGTSLAIRLAQNGLRVTLLERDKFPREKLCGEFISPECLAHFQTLGVLDEMLAAGGDRITETCFYAPNGKSISVPSEWFNQNENALGLSRAEMDLRLLEQAKRIGVEVLEETAAVTLIFEEEKVRGLNARRKNGETFEITADLTIDATGRANVLGKLAEKLRAQNPKPKTQHLRVPRPAPGTRFVGFKTHLKNAEIERGRCEIYFFRGGYGGLNMVENNLSNHCFLLRADVVRQLDGNAERIVRDLILQNKRAGEMLVNA